MVQVVYSIVLQKLLNVKPKGFSRLGMFKQKRADNKFSVKDKARKECSFKLDFSNSGVKQKLIPMYKLSWHQH